MRTSSSPTTHDIPEQRDNPSRPSHDSPNLLSPIGYRNSRCGYCGKSSGSRSYYAATRSLSAQFYEDLICRGWRRSGRTLYKPDQRASCCAQYTIRLDSLAFKPSKDQRQSLNRFNRHILGDDHIKESARLHPLSKAEATRRKQEFNLTERIHEAEYQKIRPPPEPAHKFEVTLEPDNFTEEKYLVFENYQRLVHHESPSSISRSGFRNFLCNSPLRRHTTTHGGTVKNLGSYHQCYRLDGKLVAFGVLDLLPAAVSGVYFIYHESIQQWSPGKLSALREGTLALEAGYRWYMMGFYIHSCKKMRYKGDYSPQYVLDPESYTWDLLDDDLRQRMEAGNFVSLSKEREEGMSTPNTSSLPNEPAGAAIGPDATPVVHGKTSLADDNNDDKMEGPSDTDSETSSPIDMPLYARNMPGILSRSELVPEILDHIKLRIGNMDAETSDLKLWEDSSVDDPGSIKCLIGDLMSALGPDLAKDDSLVLVF